jgi:prophage DNA circulation protein
MPLPDDFAGRTLAPAAYESVRFPAADCHTEGGHDAAEHQALRRDGSSWEPTGRKAYRGTIVAPMVDGLASYPNAASAIYFDLISKFEGTPIGTLSHPTKGTFSALISGWSEVLAPGNRSGVVLTIQWAEHNAGAGILLGAENDPARDTGTLATRQATAADAAMAAYSPAGGYTPVSPVFATQLAVLDAATRTTASTESAIATMLAAVDGNLALPLFAPATAYPAVYALVQLRATTYRLRDRYLGAAGRVRRIRVGRTIAAWEVSRQVYGDATKGDVILAANPAAMADPAAIPEGTLLTIPAAA